MNINQESLVIADDRNLHVKKLYCYFVVINYCDIISTLQP